MGRAARLATGTAVAICALALAIPAAEARFTVTPTTIDIERRPGGTASGTFDVVLNREPGDFEIQIQDAVQQPDGSFVYEQPTESPFSASSWLSITPRRFSGSPSRTQPIQFTVRVPPKAEPGDHLTSLTVTQVPSESGQITQAVQAVAVRLTVRVFGKARPSARIVSLDAPGVSGGAPVDVSAVIENDGNVALDFDGKNEASLAIIQGEERKESVEFGGELFPGQTRQFDLSWNDPPLFGQFRASVSVDVGREVVDDSKSVLQLPWRQLGAVILVVLAVAVLIVGRRRGHF
jgi:hypothetical protein